MNVTIRLDEKAQKRLQKLQSRYETTTIAGTVKRALAIAAKIDDYTNAKGELSICHESPTGEKQEINLLLDL